MDRLASADNRQRLVFTRRAQRVLQDDDLVPELRPMSEGQKAWVHKTTQVDFKGYDWLARQRSKQLVSVVERVYTFL
jgi:hypothetical protein